MQIELRDYQTAAFDAVREHIRAGSRSVLVVAPTGSGKTVLASALMQMTQEKGNRANFLVDRLSLVEQTSATFDRYGLEHGVIQAQHPRFRPALPIQICSAQTIAKRGFPPSDVDVFDESHVLHQIHKNKIALKNSIVIGLTATPFTRGLAKYFDAVVNVINTHELIRRGWLAPYRIFSCAEPDMTNVKVKTTGEWDDKEASSKALEVVGDVVQEYIKHGENRKFICSAVDTRHVEELARQFISSGISVATFTYKDSTEDRFETVQEFRKTNSTIRGLITVTAASRGFDVPDVSCIIMARPLRKSLAEHIQLLGRGLRIADGKKDCLVLDHSGNAARFFEDVEDFFSNGLAELDDGKPKKQIKKRKKPELEPIKCPNCAALHKPMPTCPSCGHEYPRRETVAHVPGTLKELIAGGYRKELENSIWAMIVWYVKYDRNRSGESAQRMAQAIYKGITGDFARRRIETTTPVEPNKEVRNRIKSNMIRWAKSKKKEGAAA